MNLFFGFMNVIVNSFKMSKIYNFFLNCWLMLILLGEMFKYIVFC